jgi:hypothetical protein
MAICARRSQVRYPILVHRAEGSANAPKATSALSHSSRTRVMLRPQALRGRCRLGTTYTTRKSLEARQIVYHGHRSPPSLATSTRINGTSADRLPQTARPNLSSCRSRPWARIPASTFAQLCCAGTPRSGQVRRPRPGCPPLQENPEPATLAEATKQASAVHGAGAGGGESGELAAAGRGRVHGWSRFMGRPITSPQGKRVVWLLTRLL